MIRAGDEQWMRLALDAARGGTPAPNPHVGAVLVAGGHAIAIGWHERAGGAHAEVVALHAAGSRARGATLYVSLEPCNHFGRTPPCVDAILAARVARVVIGCEDPNPDVIGGGAPRLRREGVDVVLGCLCADAERLIAPWRAARVSAAAVSALR